MTRFEALEILKLYRHWNEGQTSVSLALHRVRTQEDDVFDTRRELLIAAANVLRTEVHVEGLSLDVVVKGATT